LPKLNFPEFFGDNPRLWIARCENYFDMYEVEEFRWIQIASMYLFDAAARWYQSVQHRLKHASWNVFSELVLERFGREQKELLICQLFHIKQTGSVTEYVEKFAELVDMLTAYGHITEPVYYVVRFVDGLRDGIKSVVSLHRPVSFDTAASLALLQEDVGVALRPSRKSDVYFTTKPASRGANPLPPPPRIDKKSTPIFHEEKKMCEGKSLEERMAALRAYRRAKGLCVRCAEKWSREHKCVATVQLNAVQELLEVFNLEELDNVSVHSEQPDRLFMAISQDVVGGTDGPRTMKLCGALQGTELLILVDSGSSHTFLSSAVADKMVGVQPLDHQVKVQVANGGILNYTAILPQAQWSVGAYSFSTDMRVINLQHFDVILGMDWLEQNSPIKVHWKLKWMAIPYDYSTAFLQGLVPSFPEELVVHVCSLKEVETSQTNALPKEIVVLLDEFAVTFEAPAALPPERQCDHVIPLVPGAMQVHIRPYRYPPPLKDEIEKQVAEMLAKGLIQPSTSAFSSPILLVRKKDGTWRFCVDYKYLNALTLKSRFPIPVFDELMDELSQAKWFSTLDLNFGYH
jgi:predicted aspartyl protease